MFGKKIISNACATVDEQATHIVDELERASARMTTAMIIVGALAAFAVIYTVSNNGRPLQ